MTGQIEVVELINSVGSDGERVLSAIKEAGFVCVPRTPTLEMTDAAWAAALNENAMGVWRDMIDAYEAVSKGNSKIGNR